MEKSYNDDQYKVFVGSLPALASSDDVRSYFSWYGQIIQIQMKTFVKDSRPNLLLNYGYCVIVTASKHIAANILAHDHYFSDRRIICKPYLSGTRRHRMNENNNSRRVVIKNVPAHLTEDVVKSELEVYGPIDLVFNLTNRYYMEELSKRPKATKSVSVQFSSAESACSLFAQKSVKLFNSYRVRIQAYRHDLKKKEINKQTYIKSNDNLVQDKEIHGSLSLQFLDEGKSSYSEKPTHSGYFKYGQFNKIRIGVVQDNRFNLKKPTN